MSNTVIELSDEEMDIVCGYVGQLLDGDLPDFGRQTLEKLYEQIQPEGRNATGYEIPFDITEELLEIVESDDVQDALEELIARRGYDESKREGM